MQNIAHSKDGDIIVLSSLCIFVSEEECGGGGEIEQMGADVRPFSANGGLNCHHSCAQVEKNGSKSHTGC